MKNWEQFCDRDKNVIGKSNNTLIYFETVIEKTIKRLSLLHQENEKLLEEKKKLQTLIQEKDERIEGLQKIIDELKSNSNDAINDYDDETKKKLKSRIQIMLQSLDDLQLIE